MNEFTASNGARFEEHPNGTVTLTGGILDPRIELSPGMVFGLREFFHHKRDEELGRWRYPPNPVYVVYPGWSAGEEQRFARVVNEHMGLSSVVYEHDRSERGDSDIARAFFNAHPEERKPWEDAKPGEVWELTLDDHSEHTVFIHTDRTTGGRDGLSAGGGYFDIDDGAGITAGRRIWPES